MQRQFGWDDVSAASLQSINSAKLDIENPLLFSWIDGVPEEHVRARSWANFMRSFGHLIPIGVCLL